MVTFKKHAKIALVYFLIAALLGILLRALFVTSLPVTYKFILHTHSHIALSGWVYLALTILLCYCFIPIQTHTKKYNLVFWFTQVTLVGMLVSFPIQGYALYSIIFSTLFLIASYLFAWFFIKSTPKTVKTNPSYKCIKAALFYMVFSSLGPWVLGYIMNTSGSESIWYKNAIYFYLHFQYNGWFMLALVGILLSWLEKNNIYIKQKAFKPFYYSINAGIILSFFLSVLWVNVPNIFNLLGGLGAFLQIMAFWYLLMYLINKTTAVSFLKSNNHYKVLQLVLVLLCIKLLLQLLTAFNYFSELATRIVDFIIAYLHLTFLGIVSLLLFYFLHQFKLLKLSQNALAIYITGFLLSEFLIFYKGLAVWLNFYLFDSYLMVLLLVSSLLPIGIFMLLVLTIKTTN